MLDPYLFRINETLEIIANHLETIASSMGPTKATNTEPSYTAVDAKGNPITVGCYVSDGLVAGKVSRVAYDTVSFTVEYGTVENGKSVFNKAGNLLVIPESTWKKVSE